MHDGLRGAATRFGDHDAVLLDEERLTYRELEDASASLARHLADRGVSRGDRVLVMLTNRPEFPMAINAASRLGAAAVLVNSAWKALEVTNAVALCAPRCAIADAGGASVLASIMGAERVLDLDDPASAAAFELGPAPHVDVSPDDDALFVFSSGTTAQPKAVRHTHRSISAGTDHWVAALGLGSDDRFQIATPPSHILGALNLLAAAAAGATVRLHRRFDLDESLRRIEGDRLTLEMAVAPIALAMASHPALESFDLSSLRYIMWGATPVTPSVAEAITARTGVPVLPAYGASELPVITANPVDDPGSWRLDSVGLAVGDVELRVADLDTGAILGPGGVGEVQARSASTMAGYLPEEANAEAFAEGWYRTGDVGWIEPTGWVHLTDRCKEMIKVNGFQVAPAELEGVLHSHPGVADCAVFGIPDERAGERPVAAVQREPGSDVGETELLELVATSLAGYKRLTSVIFVDAVPRLPSGKVLRRTLRDEWAMKDLDTSKEGS
jgi:acyl-CoA synthetase (AMP-forming)/AMP-acid ligase II